MASLLLFRDDEGIIDENRFLAALAAMGGISSIEKNKMHGASVHCHYSADEDTVIVELKTGSRAIAISDLGPAACDFAIRFQAGFKEPLRIIDQGYNFDLQLKNYTTPAELDAGIDKALQQEDD